MKTPQRVFEARSNRPIKNTLGGVGFLRLPSRERGTPLFSGGPARNPPPSGQAFFYFLFARKISRKGGFMRTSKILITVVSILLVLILAGGIYLFTNLDMIAKNMSERIASKTMGVRVSIAKMDVRLQEKMVIASGLRIGNPGGY